ncbi:MAG: hypothetical protein AAB776_01420 [Patescibacteria group bacterium]
MMDAEVAVFDLALSFIIDHHFPCGMVGLSFLLTVLWLIWPRKQEHNILAEMASWRQRDGD